MDNQMNHFIDTQLTRLKDIFLDTPEPSDLPVIANGWQIQIVGSGSSLNAAKAVRKYFKPLPVDISTPELFLAHHGQGQPLLTTNTIFVAISQTASSIATMTTLKMMQMAGAYTILITANEAFENTDTADYCMDLMAGEELIGPKSLGYTATVVRLMQLASLLTGKTTDPASALATLPAIKRVATHWVKNHQDWSKLDFITIAASEQFMDSVDECTLKLLEVRRKPAMAYELGEFTHGPHRLMGEGAGHIFIVNEQDLAFAERIAGFAKKMGSRTVVIRAGELAAQGEGLTIPLFQSGYELQLVLVFQVLANELAATAGIDADEKVFPEFFSFVGTKTDFKKEAVTNDDSH